MNKGIVQKIQNCFVTPNYHRLMHILFLNLWNIVSFCRVTCIRIRTSAFPLHSLHFFISTSVIFNHCLVITYLYIDLLIQVCFEREQFKSFSKSLNKIVFWHSLYLKSEKCGFPAAALNKVQIIWPGTTNHVRFILCIYSLAALKLVIRSHF